MGLDQLLELTSSVASKALPICGVVVLIFLAVFVKHLIVLLKNANDAVVKMSKTLETTNRQLETLDKPLNTLNELSETVDCVHEGEQACGTFHSGSCHREFFFHQGLGVCRYEEGRRS